MSSAREINTSYYEKEYKAGYGIMFPESHVIRWYERILSYELKVKGASDKRVLDFGCGNGTHALYFASKGFKVYGMDVSGEAIAIAKKRLGSEGGNFRVISAGQDVTGIFSSKFDVIIANQVLYYLDDAHLQKLLRMLDKMLNPGGIVFFTMVSSRHYLNEHVVRRMANGMRKVVLRGRLQGAVLINVTKSKRDLRRKFAIFKPLFLGEYDFALAPHDSRHHYAFTGMKRSI